MEFCGAVHVCRPTDSSRRWLTRFVGTACDRGGAYGGFLLDVTKPCGFIGFGALDVTKPYKFIGFGAMVVTKAYEFIGFGAFWAGAHGDT